MVGVSRGSRGRLSRLSRLDAKALEALVEAGELAAGVNQPLLPSGPRRMRLRVDVEAQRVACLAVSRTRLVGAPVGHHDRDLVIVRVNAFFHRTALKSARLYQCAATRAISAAGDPPRTGDEIEEVDQPSDVVVAHRNAPAVLVAQRAFKFAEEAQQPPPVQTEKGF